MSTVIRVENLSKKYVISHQKQKYMDLRDVLAGSIKKLGKRIRDPFGGKTQIDYSSEEFWALKDSTFKVEQGDCIGLVGRNGAGKSTLLKILSRITEPTLGSAFIRGRIGSLLEVGTGFHPELTGRENIYLNGAILGMSKTEIKKKFDEIVAFAEVEKFLDTPVKRYSSGMYVRLAFAVAAHLEPEIMLIDEVLAVGDLAFQGKCLSHMKNLCQRGVTILFVSHNLLAISDLCNRALLISNGSITLDGPVDTVINSYRQLMASSKVEASSFSEYLRLIGMRFNGEQIGTMVIGESNKNTTFEMEIDVEKPIYDVYLNLHIMHSSGQNVMHLRSDISGVDFNLPKGRHMLTVRLSQLPLAPGTYMFWFRLVSIHEESSIIWDTEKIILSIEGVYPLGGIVWPKHSFIIGKMDNNAS